MGAVNPDKSTEFDVNITTVAELIPPANQHPLLPGDYSTTILIFRVTQSLRSLEKVKSTRILQLYGWDL